MAQRLNKKLLLGLGSSLGFLGTGVVSGFGINAIVNRNDDRFKQNQLAFNTLPEANFKTATDYNVATRDMFINTTNLKSFHFGNTQRGQTVTPYGWLGVFEDSATLQNRIALTGWNGEILWINEDYKNENRSDFNVYDMKYDFNTNLIFVLRSGSQNGLVDDTANSTALTSVQLDILDATTGQKIQQGGNAINANDFVSWQSQALNVIQSNFLNIRNLGGKKPITNLFQLDVVSVSANKVLVTWMPNFMLLKSLNFGTFPSLINVVDYFDELTKSFVFEKINASRINKYSKIINLRKVVSSEFSPSGSNPNWFRPWDNGFANLNDYALLANPFFTTINGNKLILHLIVAKSRNVANGGRNAEIIHKIMGFNESKGEHLHFDYDKSEQIGGKQLGTSYFNLLNVDTQMNRDTAAWSRATTFHPNFVNANLRINRNIFDGNSVVFAYPYAAQANSNNNYPIFNVAQLQIDSTTGLLKRGNEARDKKRNTNWDFGKQIIDYYNRNNGNYRPGSGVNKIYPFPNTTQNVTRLHHNYHRLISVNPFDNTFIYAAKSNLTDSLLEQIDSNSDKYASFWISTNDKFSNGKAYARPLIIGNDRSLNNKTIDRYMIDVNGGFDGLYNDGFTFDPRSLETINGGQKSLQLYFNQTGTGRNDNYANNGFFTSKIGLLDDVLKLASASDNNGSNLWVDNIANVSRISNKNLLITGIDLNSYATLIHSRANLEKWYPHTFWNNANPGNALAATRLNSASTSDARAVATTFDRILTGGEYDSQIAVDLVSAWKDKSTNGSKNPPNYNRLFVKRPEINVRNQSINNKLPTVTTYPLTSNNFLPDWLPNNAAGRFIFTKQEDLAAASYQIFSSWKNQVRINSISGNNTSNLQIEENHTFSSQPEWYDVRKRTISNGPFGKINNEVQINNKNPLRMVLRISKPQGQLPAWFSRIDNTRFFVNKYPLAKDAVPSETTFETVLQEFINEKSRQIDLGENSENVAIGLGNLKIDAFLDINPQIVGNGGINGRIFVNGNKRMIIQNQDGQRVVYEDLYTEQWHEIYDQSAINYTDFNLYGFGNRVRAAVQTSWVPNRIPPASTKIKAFVDANNLPDTLVRKSATEQNIFSFKYKENDQSKLVVTPVDPSWLKNHLFNFQRLISMQARFEYQQAGSNNWLILTTTNDASIRNSWNNANNTFELPSSNLQNITKLRLVLIPISANDSNNFVQIENANLSANNSKFTSAEQNISSQKVTVDSNWFNQIKLTNNSNSLINLTAADVQEFEKQILKLSPQIQANDALRSKIRLVYRWNNQQEKLDANQLVNKILTAFRNYNASDSGVFSLWNGQNGIKIKATFESVDSSVELITPNNNAPDEATRSGFVQSTIKSVIDLGPYLTELRNGVISATMLANQPGQIDGNSIRFPKKQGQPGQDRFNDLDFTTIQNRLRAGLGVTNHYKKWLSNSNNWSNWLTNLNEVNTYNTAKPQIKLGFDIPTNWNVKLVDGNTEITSDTEIDLNLAVPKLVKLPSAAQISQLLQTFNARGIFSGNTFNLIIDEPKLSQGLDAVANILKTASSTSPNDFNGLENQIVLKFKLGNSDYLEATELKKWLANQSDDQPNNELKMKIELKQLPANQQPDFVLEEQLINHEFNLLDNQNSHLKIWLHGKLWEAALEANGISVQGNRLNLTYQFNQVLQVFSDGFNDVQQLALEWRQYNGNNTAGQWTQGALPNQVPPTISKIEVRIAEATKVSAANRYFIYGPQQNETAQKGDRKFATIDLNTIATVLKVDKTWFRTNRISDDVISLTNLTADKIRNWENKIWQLVPETNEATIRNKVTIKYQFLNKLNLTADTLPQELIRATTDYANTTHHGIVQLWDGGNQNGLRIKATFEKAQPTDNTIQFANLAGQIIDGDNNKPERTDDIHTGNVHTTLDLSAWVNNLINNPTVVNTTQPGTIPVNGLIPPQLAGQPNSALFAGAAFSDIESWLKAANVNVFWAKNLNAPISWNPTNATTSYDPKLGLLYLAFENRNNNLNLMIDNSGTNIAPNQDNRANPLTITLQAPKVLTINANDFNGLNQAFSGNTKFLNVTQSIISQKIQAVLNRHGNAFANAPLTMEFQVGQGRWFDYRNLTTELAKATTDLQSGAIMARFALQTNNASNEWSFDLSSVNNVAVFNDTNSPIKIFINDQGIYDALKDETTLAGSNQALEIRWPRGWTVTNNGILNAGQIGRGLKLEFSFANLDQAIAAGNNIETDWIDQMPNNFDIRFQNLYIRLQVSDPNKFVYEKIFSNETNSPVQPNGQSYKFALDLSQLNQIIELDGLWLNQTVVSNNIDLADFDLTELNAYEQLVFQAVQYDQTIKDKIVIVYQFNNEINLTKEQLVTKIQQYSQTNNANNTSDFGILKLWNQNSGQKIVASFAKKESTGNYELTYKNPQQTNHVLDTAKVISTIDLKPVVNWLKTIRVNVSSTKAGNTITSLTFPPISANGNPFNQKQWPLSTTVLKQLGVVTQYQIIDANTNNPGWSEDLNSINKYDDRGQFKVRFVLKQNIGNNLKILISNTETLANATTGDQTSNEIIVNLAVAKVIKLDQATINQEFINNDAIRGNTKNLTIDSQKEQTMIRQLLNWNQQQNPNANPAYSTAQLQVLYAIGRNPDVNNANLWKSLADFITDLAGNNQDQPSNQINFRFKVITPANQEPDFLINENQIFQLNSHETPSKNTRIKYFVNKSSWETSADQISLNGTNTNINWNLSAFGTNKVEEVGGLVYLRTDSGRALQLQFTTKDNASYTDNEVANNVQEIATKWVKEKPTNLPVNTQIIKVRIVENDGYYYEPAHISGADAAKVHNINFNVQLEIRVDSAWLNQSLIAPQQIEIKNFDLPLIQTWITNLRNQIKTQNNNLDDANVNKIDIEFSYNGAGNFTAQELINKIQTELSNYNSNELGIIQLWNGSRGVKINATFKNTDPTKIVLKDPQGGSNFSADLNTANVYTEIDLINYTRRLMSEKTSVTKADNNPASTAIRDFTPPIGIDDSGFLNGKTYETIAQRLSAVGINIKFSETGTGGWVEKTAIKKYVAGNDPKLFVAFYNENNNNIKLKINTINNQMLIIQANANNEDQPVSLPLAVPKQISVLATDFNDAIQILNFGGNTRDITFTDNADQTIINKILVRNGIDLNANPTPNFLKIRFRIGGNNYQYKELRELKEYLKNQPETQDFTSRVIDWEVFIDPSQNQEWVFAANSQTQGNIANEQNSPIKIFINNQNIFEDLSETIPTGDSDNLQLPWKNNLQINPQNGILTGQNRGVGLKVEFTFRTDLTGEASDVTNADWYQGWSPQTPTRFKSGIDRNLFLRLQVSDSKYFYAQANQKITLDLSRLKQIITLDTQWLEQEFLNQTVAATAINNAIISAYESKVQNAILIEPSLKTKVVLRYNFNNKTNLDKAALIQAINDYTTTNTNDNSLGILQLYNGVIGKEISVQFAKADPTDNSYDLKFIGINNKRLDTSKAITIINFEKVLNWLKTIEIAIEPAQGRPNGIAKLKIPAVNASQDSFFNNREWDQVESALQNFGIIIQYRSLLKSNQNNDDGWQDNQSAVNEYDPTIGKFQIRFRFENQKAKNVKLQLATNNIIDGTSTQPTTATDIKLKIQLVVQINNKIVENNFINVANVIQGDTKNLVIDANAEQNLINAIKAENSANNNNFDQLNLLVQYQLGEPQPDGIWKSRTEFLTDLAGAKTDQTTNKIVFRFAISPEQAANFSVSQTPYVLHEKQAPTANLKVKYYVHKAQWETKAEQLNISGTNTQFNWNFNQAFGSGNFSEQNNKVYLINDVGQALQIQFTTKANANYNDPNSVSDQLSDLSTKWVRVKPTSLPANVTTLKVRLVANDGFVYQGATDAPAVHDVEFRIQTEIKVNKVWLSDEALVTTETEIATLDETKISTWENKIYQKIVDANGIDLATAQKVQLKYTYDTTANLTKQQLIAHIKAELTNFAGSNLGIVQLWDGQRGIKIKATFSPDDANSIIIKDLNNPNANDFTNELNVEKIYTNVDLSKYVTILTTAKTIVTRAHGAPAGQMQGFTPPEMPTDPAQQFAGKTYQNIATRLGTIGITIEFAKAINGTWMAKDQIKEYDARGAKLYLAFTNRSSNIRLKINANLTLNQQNSDNKTNPLALPLNVPKQIIITNQDLDQLATKLNFSGNTKIITFNENAVNTLVSTILQRNATETNDQSFLSASLKMQFQIGNLEFTEASELKRFLDQQTNDLVNRAIKYKFVISGTTNEFELAASSAVEHELFNDQSSPIKIYINDKNIFTDLQATQLSGDNTNLIWRWQKDLSVNASTGVLNSSATPPRGVGLKVEFTFNQQLNGASNEAVGNNSDQEWVSAPPTTFKPEHQNIYLRLNLIDDSKYEYVNLNRKITLSLANIQKIIVLQNAWLNQTIADQAISLDDFLKNEQKITEYENKVNQTAQNNGINASLINGQIFRINYLFKGQTYEDKQALMNALRNYKNSQSNGATFGILQLWNNDIGEQITTKFVDANENDNYIIKVDNQEPNQASGIVLNTAQIITTIDFSKVIKWLTETDKLVNVEGNANNITRLEIPNVNAVDDLFFNNRPWDQVVNALQTMGITTEYREMLTANLPDNDAGWSNQISSIKKYNESIGKIQIRFKFNASQAKNIKFKTSSAISNNGATDTATGAFLVNLNIRLTIQIDNGILNQFINQNDVIDGNTKYLTINQARETEMIEAIKTANQANNNAFANARLIVKYKLADQPEENWAKLNDFVSALRNTNTDQTSNKVLFRFEVENPDDFQVDPAAKTLFDPQNEPDPNNWKVKFYINNSTWENDADTVEVTGKSSQLKWIWNALRVQESNNQVGTNGLQVEFTTKNNATYIDPVVSNNLADLTTKWITLKPNQIAPTTNQLFIRLKAKAGYIYGPADTTNGNQASADVHTVNLNIKREILVDPNNLATQLTIAANSSFVDQIQESDLINFVNQALNGIEVPLRPHVTVKFSFNNETDLTAQILYARIQEIINNNQAPNYGILQLWNNIIGTKIRAHYTLTNLDGEYELVAANGDPEAEQDIITAGIKTKINLITIINDLKKKKINFTKTNKQNRATVTIADWQMPSIKDGTEALNGLTWDVFENRLREIGVLIEARVVRNPEESNPSWKPLAQIKEYDDSTLQLAFRFRIEADRGKNIILSVESDGDVDPTKSPAQLISNEFRMNINAPATITVSPNQLRDFEQNNQISGNTKFIKLDNVAEQNLIQLISTTNETINPTIFNGLANRLYIEYYLGDDAQTATADQWKQANDFKEFLKNQTNDQSTNQIWYRLNVRNEQINDPNYQIFNIDQTPHILAQKAVGQANAKVKIFIHQRNYETLADQIRVQGTNNQFNWVFPTGLNPNNQGTFDTIIGLRIQYSIKKGIVNKPYIPNGSNDPTNGWSNQQPIRIDPRERYLVVQLVADEGFVYQAQYDETTDGDKTNWGIHEVNLEALKSEIKLSNSGLNQIVFQGLLPDLAVAQIKQLEIQAKMNANFEDSQLQNKVKIEYQINWGTDNLSVGWKSIDELSTIVQTYMQNFANNHAGLLKFNGFSTTAFATIKARFATTDNQFIVVDQDANDGLTSAQNGKDVKTDQLTSPIDLKQFRTILETTFVTLNAGSTQTDLKGFVPPGMENAAANTQFAGKTFDEMVQILATVGIIVEYLAPQPNQTENWVTDRSLIKRLNNQNELYLRFRLDPNVAGLNTNQLANWAQSFSITTKTNPEALNQNNQYATERIKLKVDLPILITTNAQDLLTYNFEFTGNTWKINNVAAVKTIVEAKVQELLLQQSSNVTNLSQAPLKIQFSLSNLQLDGNQIWFDIEELAQKLQQISSVNFNTNEIKGRWFIDENQIVDGQRYQISDQNAIIIQKQNNTINAKLKMYIHEGQYSDQERIVQELIATGSTENYSIPKLSSWHQTLIQQAQGLAIQLSNDPNQANWTNWNQPGDEPKPLPVNKDLWFRYQIKAGYEFAQPDPNNASFTTAIKLNTSQIRVVLRLQSAWLKLIKLNGNLKNLNIEENDALEQLIPALPNQTIRPIIFEYTYNGQDWFEQNAFKAKLIELAGKKDNANFILKREEIRVRFAWNKSQGITDNQYGMIIDQTPINDEIGAARFYTNLIKDDEQLNSLVLGYINMVNLPDFVKENFAITGSSSKPKFIANRRNQLNTAFNPYVNLNLFDVLYSTQYNSNDRTWSWDDTKSVLKNGQLISENGLIDAGVQIGPDKKFALKFISKNPKYNVYDLQENQQADGYVLDLSDQVQITIEITNPFKAQNKTLALWWTQDQNKTQGKYYQGEGGFKIVNGLQDGDVDFNDYQSALSWLKSSASGLHQNEIQALEFVYHVYDGEPDEAEIQRVSHHSLITNYNDGTWKRLEPILDSVTNASDFTRSLNLKVGQYVSVALRVKEEFASGDNIFTLNNNEHSFMRPFSLDKTKFFGRAHGYMVKTAELEIEKNKIVLENMLNSEQDPLDGYTNIKRLNLKQDQKENYQGVDLELELFHEFHKGKNKEEVIITPFDKIKLVKREENNTASQDFFKDANGNQIRDDANQPIPILVDVNGRPNAPIKTNQPIREKFINYESGFFGLTAPASGTSRDKWGIFKNETVNIVFKARLGLGGINEPDFILDQTKIVDLQDVISPQIKFPIFNQNNIKYDFNHDEFTRDKIQFENATKPNEAPIDGKSKVKTLIKLSKTSNQSTNVEVIEGNNAEDAVIKLKAEINRSFNNKLRFETIYEKKDGGVEVTNDLDLYKLNNLKNNDRIKVRLVSADNDFIWAEPPKTLTIHVNGLTAKAPQRERLKFLRVEQSGEVNGKGAFKVLVNNPQDSNSDSKEILEGWKFVIRVWDKEKQIKTDWTSDQNRIVNLQNGDKVEWKLLDEFNNPVSDPYYNTIAGEHKLDENGITEFVFNEVNYPQGKTSAEIVNSGIGQYPADSNIYPEKSGFVISGLKDALEVFEISDAAFTKVMSQLEPHYVGLNGQGTINFKADYLNKNYYVNSRGELYEKSLEQPTFKQQVDTDVAEISLADFLANTTFYTSDPNLINYQNGFKFLGNDTNLNNHLSNGDQVWAQFDLQVDNNEVNRGISTQLNPVTGLQELLTDPMTPLWYILMAIGGVLTFGGLSLLVLWAKRHRKLKK